MVLLGSREEGADIKFVTAEEYQNKRMEIMEEIKEEIDIKEKGFMKEVPLYS
ncbi:hypothetical protein [Marinisporobacter balticus]|uniref:Uncharacterized protein n=1 Tax=Marinisporobacter balticus TaxID=2018667 RepID=A0A4R2KMF0_9FIRM|nr:hypothetical protein [Marinisporobacter balticus]TCO67735.1 hypothetical protein EV214_1563 [Marinisporobacter balticus]